MKHTVSGSDPPAGSGAWDISPVGRRRFLQLLGGTTAAMLVGCTPESLPGSSVTSSAGTSSPTTTAAGASDPIGVWREIRDAVRASPDHLAARAADVVAGGDPEAIFAFVRDSVRAIPPRRDGLGGTLTQTRWGTTAALRSGVGTPRDKVDLLATLLQDAGFEVRVVQGRLDSGIDPATLFSGGQQAGFDLGVEEAVLDRWLGILGVGGVPAYQPFDGETDLSNPLADQVLSFLPSDLEARPFDFTLDLVPLVEVDTSAGIVHLNPLVPQARFGEAYADQLAPAPPSTPIPEVSVALQIARSHDPSVRQPVVEGLWPLSELVGRRVLARFVPEGDPKATFSTPATHLRTFTGMLAVDDPHRSIEELAELVLFGSSVTVDGDVLSVTDHGLTVNGTPLGAQPGTDADVAALSFTIEPASFPLIRLRAGATSSAGDPVEGIPAEAFVLEEDGNPLPFVLRQTRPPVPKIMLLLDTSASLPDIFRLEGAADVSRKLAEGVLVGSPDAQLRIAGVALGQAAAAPSWSADPAEVYAEASRVVGYGSEIWSAVGDANRYSPNLIVLVTDGASTDSVEQITTAKPRVAAGAPVVTLLVGEADNVVPAEMAALSGGAVFEVADHELAVTSILRHLEQRSVSPLEFQYEAPEAGARERIVALRAGGAEATGAYGVPPAGTRLDPPGIAGIYLVVRFEGTEVVRTLAGIPAETASSSAILDVSGRQGVRAVLLGSACLSVEGGAPTLSAWLDDLLTTRLTWGPLFELAGGRSGLVDAVASGIRDLPIELVLLHSQLDDPSTFEVAPRMALLTRHPTWEGGEIRRADLLPFLAFATVNPDPRSAFTTTIKQTARLAAAEAHLYEDSTTSRLESRLLTHLAAGAAASREGPFAIHAKVIDSYSLRHRLLPTDDGAFAFWTIDGSGTLIGILPDGSGGGATPSPNDQCKAIGQGAALSDLAGAGLGLGFAFGAFIALQKAIVKQVLREAAIIATIGSDPPDTSACGSPGDFPCDLAKDLLFGAIPGGKAIGTYDKVWAAATGNDAFNC